MSLDNISQIMLAWLNQYPGKPVDIVDFEFLTDDMPGMALSVIQGPYKTRQYIYGGFEAQYQFQVLYRIQPGRGAVSNARLSAVETLNRLGDWATSRKDYPYLGDGVRVKKISVAGRAIFEARSDNGDENYQITITMLYEVI